MTSSTSTTSLHGPTKAASASRRRTDAIASVAAYGVFAISFLFAGAVVLGILP